MAWSVVEADGSSYSSYMSFQAGDMGRILVWERHLHPGCSTQQQCHAHPPAPVIPPNPGWSLQESSTAPPRCVEQVLALRKDVTLGGCVSHRHTPSQREHYSFYNSTLKKRFYKFFLRCISGTYCNPANRSWVVAWVRRLTAISVCKL